MAEAASPPEAAAAPLALGADGVGWLTLDLGGRANVLAAPDLERLDAVLSQVEALASADTLRALVLRSERRGAFATGPDLDELRALTDAASTRNWALQGQRVLRRLEVLPIPTIAAIGGACLGSGVGLALACSYRLASDAAAVRLGLPEIRIGVIPGFGVLARLPRLIGLQASLELALGGEAVPARRAQELGLVDRVFAVGEFDEQLGRFVAELLARGRLRAGGRRPVRRRLLEDTAPGRRVVTLRAARQLVPRAADPEAARQVVRVMSEGLALPLEDAFAREVAAISERVPSERSRALRHLYENFQRVRHLSVPPPDVREAAVVGGGETGSEFAHLLAAAGIPTRVRDLQQARAAAAVERARERLLWSSVAGRLSEHDRRAGGALLSATAGFGGFGVADVVIVSVGSERARAAAAVREVEAHTRPGSLIAVSGPALVVEAAQEGLSNPERVAGLQLTPPADLFPLLEVVPGAHTAPETVTALRGLARRLGATPVVVADRAGSPGHRLLARLLAEAARMLDEGAVVPVVDEALEEAGFLLGPFRRMDGFGIDRTVAFLHRMADAIGERVRPSPRFDRLAREPTTFYRYRGGLPQGPAPGMARKGGVVSGEEALDRVVAALMDECARILAEDGVSDPGDLDVIAAIGLGFPRDRGGPVYAAVSVDPPAASGHERAGVL